MPSTPFWLYRVGVGYTDANSNRFIATETWLTTDPFYATTSLWWTPLYTLSFRYTKPFGSLPDTEFYFGPGIYYELTPLRKQVNPFNWLPSLHLPTLNAAAPEAAVRLQRVGADGSIGRICIPLLSDRYYTDLPHRRHIDAATLQGSLVFGDSLNPIPFVYGGVTYYPVNYHRRDNTWSIVTSYVVKENPVRIWRRWRTYDYAHRATKDRFYIPTEGLT